MKATIKYDEMYYDCELRTIDKYHVSVRIYAENLFFHEAVEAFVNNNESVTFNNEYIFVVIDRKNVQEILI